MEVMDWGVKTSGCELLLKEGQGNNCTTHTYKAPKASEAKLCTGRSQNAFLVMVQYDGTALPQNGTGAKCELSWHG